MGDRERQAQLLESFAELTNVFIAINDDSYRDALAAGAAALREAARLEEEIADARGACPSVRMQDHFDDPLLALIGHEVSRGFMLDALVAELRTKLDQAKAEIAALKEVTQS